MIEQYEHHGRLVWTRTATKGKHRAVCLCHVCTMLDTTDREKNCPIANKLYALCVEFGLTTPVFECPSFCFDKSKAKISETAKSQQNPKFSIF